jgi:hypothetical protein
LRNTAQGRAGQGDKTGPGRGSRDSAMPCWERAGTPGRVMRRPVLSLSVGRRVFSRAPLRFKFISIVCGSARSERARAGSERHGDGGERERTLSLVFQQQLNCCLHPTSGMAGGRGGAWLAWRHSHMRGSNLLPPCFGPEAKRKQRTEFEKTARRRKIEAHLKL